MRERNEYTKYDSRYIPTKTKKKKPKKKKVKREMYNEHPGSPYDFEVYPTT